MLDPIWRDPAADGWIKQFLRQLLKEPPMRIVLKQVIAALPMSVRLKVAWDAVARPWYLLGIFRAAQHAVESRVPEITAIEFGVAGGKGLLALQKYAKAVESELGIKISVFGFDSGKGLTRHCGDYRDHPDRWMPGDFPMNEQWLRSRLDERTKLILGPVADTVPKFVQDVQTSPIGFLSMDLDLYSSTTEALKVLTLPGKKTLKRVPVYFDDVALEWNHRFAGELLAIDEFNQANKSVKIDRWRGIEYDRAFPESSWVGRMYLAHDLDAIGTSEPDRPVEYL
ncbi:MAG: hypothetical protein WB992_17120 [Bryobacteraceae bacterium]